MTKISRKLIRFVLPLVFAFLLGTVTAQAATYYVAQSGNDAYACPTAQTITTPKRTFASAVSCLAPGDTLYIRAGIWTEAINMGGKAGTVGKIITIAAYPGETVRLRPVGSVRAIAGVQMNYITFDGLIWDGIHSNEGVNGQYSPLITNGTHDFTFQNMEFVNVRGMILINDGSWNITIRRCRIHDFLTATGEPGTRYLGIYIHDGSNIIVEDSDIYNNPGGGMQIQPGPLSNVTIRGNKIHHNNTLTTQPSIGGIIVYASNNTTAYVRDVYVYNNLVYSNGLTSTSSEYSPGINISQYVANARVWNNTVYNNRWYGILVQRGASPPTNTIIQNNISYGNLTGNYNDNGSGTLADHNLFTDPKFVNASALDLALQTNSPAVDAGMPLSLIKTDFRKASRPQGLTHDIGAYEGTSAASAAPAAPKGLRVQ